MVQVSYSNVFAIEHDRGYDEHIQAGDLVRTGGNSFPHFRVVAVAGDKAWVQNILTGLDGLTALSRCRRINGAPAG